MSTARDSKAMHQMLSARGSFRRSSRDGSVQNDLPRFSRMEAREEPTEESELTDLGRETDQPDPYLKPGYAMAKEWTLA